MENLFIDHPAFFLDILLGLDEPERFEFPARKQEPKSMVIRAGQFMDCPCFVEDPP